MLGSGQLPFDTSHQQQLALGSAPRTSSCPQPQNTAPPRDALGYRAQAESRQEPLLLGSQETEHPGRGDVLQPNLFLT